MIGNILLMIGSILIIGWGLFHLILTGRLVDYYKPIAEDKKRILAMEYVVEGFMLCFIGILVLLVTLSRDASSISLSVRIYRLSAIMVAVMAVWTAVTGGRTPIVLIKICPVMKALIAILFFLGSIL
jgi:hypothetical protein